MMCDASRLTTLVLTYVESDRAGTASGLQRGLARRVALRHRAARRRPAAGRSSAVLRIPHGDGSRRARVRYKAEGESASRSEPLSPPPAPPSPSGWRAPSTPMIASANRHEELRVGHSQYRCHSLLAVEVDYTPGAAFPSHTHAKSAFTIESKVNDGETRIYRAGESWPEPPGAIHSITHNASKTEPAKLLAVFVFDTNVTL
jgi:quercetin dioxygenase-like cupin family protein